MKQHALSAAFPAMWGKDLEDLADDIKANGLREPITVYEGEVLDGWHRYQACAKANIEAETEEFDGDDPMAFVLSKNAHRRHLTGSQRAAAIVKCAEWKPRGANQHAKEDGTERPILTSKQMAEAVNVSKKSIDRAKSAESAGLGDAVRDGKVSVTKAAEIAAAPPKQRAAAVAAIEKGEKPKTAKPKPNGKHAPDLADENAALREQLAELGSTLEEMQAENEAMGKIIDADDRVAAAVGEIKRLKEEVRILRGRVAGLLNEKDAAVSQANKFSRQVKKLNGGKNGTAKPAH